MSEYKLITIEEEDEFEDKLNLFKNENKPRERIAYIWSVPAKGHSNPVLCFTNQLLLKLNEMKIDKIVFYSCSSFRESILNLPNNLPNSSQIEFRDYELKKYCGSDDFLKLIMNFDTKPGSLFRFFQCWENAIKIGSDFLFEKLIADLHREKPVLVVYDQALFFSKITLKLYSKLYSNEPQPLRCCYVTCFLCAKDIFPLWNDMFRTGMMGSMKYSVKNVLLTVKDFFTYTYKYYKTFWWDHNFSLYELIFNVDVPFAQDIIIDDSLNIIFVLPQIQPRVKFFQRENIKFVGPALDESVRLQISDTYSSLINEFMAKNTNPIIYVSMGTVFNFENSDLFQVIVEACKSFLNTHSVIVSTGDEKTYAKYSKSSQNNVIFVPHAPQIEILKKACLFITHAGMNSVSEAIHYAVPFICIPLFADQNFVAWRVADELGIGIRLSVKDSFTVDKVKIAIRKVLNDPFYCEQIAEFSLLSQKYSEAKFAVQHLINYVKENVT